MSPYASLLIISWGLKRALSVGCAAENGSKWRIGKGCSSVVANVLLWNLCCAPRLVPKPRWRVTLPRLIFSFLSANQRWQAVSWKCSISTPSCSTWAVSQPCTSCTCTVCSRFWRFALMGHGMWLSSWGAPGPCWIHAVLCPCSARSVPFGCTILHGWWFADQMTSSPFLSFSLHVFLSELAWYSIPVSFPSKEEQLWPVIKSLSSTLCANQDNHLSAPFPFCPWGLRHGSGCRSICFAVIPAPVGARWWKATGKPWVCSVKQGLHHGMGAIPLPSTVHCVLLQWGQPSDVAGIQAVCCCCPSPGATAQHSGHCCSHTGEITRMCVFYFQGAFSALWLSALLSGAGVLQLGH